ncbi:H-NS histone family protein [Zoogloea dura]|uniref:H-NS histone family protein n=1 Tax=Zoogloea dura TaxID=2728840 RepID=A0A848G7H8_9RHOO|nr:H-NS histone family protein [Zoogloea dura]NML26885.1 H-NS histone family protein [Zoogloea dura]
MSTVDELKDKLAKLNEQLAMLTAEKVQVEAELKEAERSLKQAAMNEIIEKVKALGLDMSEIAESLGLVAAEPKRRKARAEKETIEKKGKGVPKYRSSVDASLTWTGKGRKPAWIQTYLNNGGDLDAWLIKD